MNVTETLKERGKDYGDYESGIELRAALINAISDRYKGVHGENMRHTQKLRIYDIVCKLSRLAVTPDHIDSWHDIQGYARLSEEDYSQAQPVQPNPFMNHSKGAR